MHSFTGLLRTLGVTGGVLLFLATDVDAASWQWSSRAGRERVVLELDTPRQEKGAARTGPAQLDISLDNASSLALAGAGPALGSLVSGLSAEGDVLRLNMRDGAFGYIVSRPNPRQVVIDVFPDPLGTRWRAPGAPAPATAASRALSAQPVVPFVQPPVAPAAPTVPPAQTGAAPGRPGTPAGTPQTPVASSPERVPVQPGTPPRRPETTVPPAQPQGTGYATEPRTVPEPVTTPNSNASPRTTMGRMAEARQAENTPSERPVEPEQTIGLGKDGALELRGRMTPDGNAPAIPPQVTNPNPADTNGNRRAAQGTPPRPAGQTPDPQESPSSWSALGNPGSDRPSERGQATNEAPWKSVGTAPSSASVSPSRGRAATPPPAAQAVPAQPSTATPQRTPAPAPRTPAVPQPTQQVPQSPRAEQNIVQPPTPSDVPGGQGTPEEALAEYTPSGAVRGRLSTGVASVRPEDMLAQSRPEAIAGTQTALPPAGAPSVAPGQPEKGQPGKGQPEKTPPRRETPPSSEPADKRNATSPPERAVAQTPSQPQQPPKAPDTAKVPGSASGVEILSPNALRAQLNPSGPENWTAENSVGTENYMPPQRPEGRFPSQPESRKALVVPKDETPEPAPEVIYVDEAGNTVPKPPDSPDMIAQARKLLDASQYAPALEMLQQIKGQNLTPGQLEDVLYMISEATNRLYADRWLEGYEPVVVSTNEAMNYNLRSPRVPEALMRLGMINLLTGNQDEAAGYFGALKSKYPLDPNTPIGLLALGKDQFDKGQYADAVKTFKEIIDSYPDSKPVQPASRLMADALFRQGHNQRALVLVDFVDRRWPRLYLEDPDYLRMVGELYYQEGRLQDALHTYLTYYNLIPDNPENDKVLLRLGTIYLKDGLLKAAHDVFEELLRKYPQSASAPIALQRLGEEGMYDGNPSLDELIALFNRPNTTSPDIFYRRILKEYPKSPEIELARLRLAAWGFWNKDTQKSMEDAQKFIDDYPNSPSSRVAEDIIRRGFDREFKLAKEEENYDRILSLWERYPQVQAAHADLDDELRVALARAQLNRGNEKQGMDMLSGFLDRPTKDPTYGEYVYNMFLARALHSEDWNEVLALGEKVGKWDLPIDARNQLDYARAISAENLGSGEKALPLWRKLHTREDLPLYQKAYATYFMARDAEHRRDLGDAYRLNLDTLNLFTKLEEDRSDKADPERIRESLAALMDVTEVANRFAEALDWAEKYARFVPEGSSDYAGLRFRVAGLHRKMGDLGRWRAILNEIIKREPESVFGRMAASELRTQEVARDLTRFTPNGQ